MRRFLTLAVILVAILAGCASPKIAQKKSVEVGGQRLELSGVFDGRSSLSITINGDPVLNGRFPPFTPTLSLKSPYRGLAVRANCYFSSILSGRSGVVGIVAGAVQSSNNRSSDKCDVLVDEKVVETLFF